MIAAELAKFHDYGAETIGSALKKFHGTLHVQCNLKQSRQCS
jgi:hypothetical protein